MVCVGIDVAKDKHDCCILDSDGTIRADCFTIPNNMDGFKQLLRTIRDCTERVSAFAKPKLIVWMQERLQLCYCPM